MGRFVRRKVKGENDVIIFSFQKLLVLSNNIGMVTNIWPTWKDPELPRSPATLSV